MTAKKRASLIVKKPSPSEKLFFLDFTIEREEWNKYRLNDGELLRVKLVMTGFYMEETLEKLVKRVKPKQDLVLNLGIGSRPLYSLEAPSAVRGKAASKGYTKEELLNSVIEEEVDFETTRASWNSYLLENGIHIKARINPIAIRKTDKFDIIGNPVYLFESGVDIKISLPEKIESRIRQKLEAKTLDLVPKAK